jgi:hypothetical protein
LRQPQQNTIFKKSVIYLQTIYDIKNCRNFLFKGQINRGATMKRLSHYHSRQNRDTDSIILTFSPVQQMLIAMMEHNGVEALETFGGKQFFDHRPPTQ